MICFKKILIALSSFLLLSCMSNQIHKAFTKYNLWEEYSTNCGIFEGREFQGDINQLQPENIICLSIGSLYIYNRENNFPPIISLRIENDIIWTIELNLRTNFKIFTKWAFKNFKDSGLYLFRIDEFEIKENNEYIYLNLWGTYTNHYNLENYDRYLKRNGCIIINKNGNFELFVLRRYDIF